MLAVFFYEILQFEVFTFLCPVLRKIEDDTYIGPKRKFRCTLLGAILSLLVNICFKGVIKLLQIKEHPEKMSSKE